MKTTIYIIVFIAMFFYVSKTNIQFAPFKIQFGALQNGIGWCLIAIGLYFILYSSYNSGYEKGIDDTCKELIEKAKEPEP